MAKYLLSEYKGFKFNCETVADENRLKNYIDSLGDGIDSLPDVCEENYANRQADFDFSGVNQLVLPKSIKRIVKNLVLMLLMVRVTIMLFHLITMKNMLRFLSLKQNL